MDTPLSELLDDLYRQSQIHDRGQADRLRRWRNVEPETARLMSVLIRALAPRRLLERLRATNVKLCLRSVIVMRVKTPCRGRYTWTVTRTGRNVLVVPSGMKLSIQPAPTARPSRTL